MMSLVRPLLFCALGLWALHAFTAHAADENTTVYADSRNLTAISDALFKKGVLSTDDPAAVEEYIRIHYCGLYEQYGMDDFAWNRIRETQARDLDLRLASFPDGMEVASALHISQYDMGVNQFLIATRDQMDNMGLVTLYNNDAGSVSPCLGGDYSSFVPRVHPLQLVVRLDKPISLTGIPMSRANADELINFLNKRPGTEDRKREITLVMRVRITGVDPLAGVTDKLRRTVLGHLDEILIYEGPERKNLLYKKDLRIQPDGKSKS